MSALFPEHKINNSLNIFCFQIFWSVLFKYCVHVCLICHRLFRTIGLYQYLHTMNLFISSVSLSPSVCLRTGYYTVYRQAYSMEMQTVYRCCPGWMQRGEEGGCLHSEYHNTVLYVCVVGQWCLNSVLSTGVCSSGTCFNGGKCSETGDQLCQCPEGFEGMRCQYGESLVHV